LQENDDDVDIDISDEDILKKRDNSYAKSMKLIDEELMRKKRNRFFKSTLPRLRLVVACLLLIFIIGATTAIAAIPSIRVRVLELLINIEKEYMEISLVENESLSFDVPSEWNGKYFLSYIPRGSYEIIIDQILGSDEVFYIYDDDAFFFIFRI